MDNRFTHRIVVSTLAVLVFTLTGYSQARPDIGADRPTTSSQKANDQRDNATNDHGAAITTAIEMNQAEIEVGKLAAQKAQAPKVKDFANRMVKDHTQALGKLQALNGGSTASIKPNTTHQQLKDRLAQLPAGQFDREYINAMVNDHQDAVHFLEQQGGELQTNSGGSATHSQAGAPGASSDQSAPQASTRPSSDARKTDDFARLAKELLPTVRQHLQLAQQIQKDLSSSPNSANQSANPDTNSKPKPNSGRPR